MNRLNNTRPGNLKKEELKVFFIEISSLLSNNFSVIALFVMLQENNASKELAKMIFFIMLFLI